MTLFQTDLFTMPEFPGLSFEKEIISSEEEKFLIASIDATDLTPFQFRGWLGKRLTASFGWRYDFNNGSFVRTEPIPEWLQPFRQRAAQFAELEPAELEQALLIRYDPGAGIDWHKDRPVYDRFPKCQCAGRWNCFLLHTRCCPR